MATSELDTRVGAGVQNLTGGQAIAQTLVACGIERVFGLQGGGVTGLLGPILQNGGIETTPCRSEISAAWMSSGYNRVRGRCASACLVHEVGVLHAAPAIYAAKVDSTPLFVIGVNLASTLDLREPLQEGLELFPSLRPISKYIRRIVSGDDVPLAIRQAVLSASTGRFGPSVLDVFYQVLRQPVRCAVEEFELPGRQAADQEALARAVELICSADRPVLFVGAGVHLSGAEDTLIRFAESVGMPVVTTQRGGRGAIPDMHPLCCGPVGSFGWSSANTLVQEADLWLAVGTTFSQMTTAAWTLEKPEHVIQIDIDPGQLGKIFQPTVGIPGDARAVLKQLHLSLADDATELRDRWMHLAEEVASLKQEWLSAYRARYDGTEVPINQLYVSEVLNQELPDNAMVIPDSGSQAAFMYRGYHIDDPPAGRVASTRYQSLGAGLPLAIGAKLADPGRVVVSYHGDGGFYYDMSDMATLAARGIKVIVIIDNNGCLLANRSGWKLMGHPAELGTWTELPDTEFVTIAKGMGLPGERVTEPGDFAGAVQRALASPTSYLIDVVTDPETRMKRAIPGVIPMLSDRPAEETELIEGARKDPHYELSLHGAWPRNQAGSALAGNALGG